jgi:hypothetical protein
MFPKTVKTAMEEAMTMSAGFPRDKFTTPLVVQDPFRNTQVVTIPNEKQEDIIKKIPIKFILISGLIGAVYFSSRKK